MKHNCWKQNGFSNQDKKYKKLVIFWNFKKIIVSLKCKNK